MPLLMQSAEAVVQDHKVNTKAVLEKDMVVGNPTLSRVHGLNRAREGVVKMRKNTAHNKMMQNQYDGTKRRLHDI
jgi:hypothetical protein